MTRKMLGTAAAAWAALLLAGCASSPVTTTIVVPDSLKVADTQTLSLEVKATGVQIYQCAVAKADATQFEWRFVAPEADLFDNDGEKVGKHYAGPTWESTDGSKVVGALQAHSDAPEAGAIPWLLLNAKSTDGIGVFGLTKSIQRLQTSGGNAPADGCDQAQLGKEARMPYKAIYRFYSAKP